MSFPPRLVTVLCLLQALFVVMGYFLTHAFLKVYYQTSAQILGSHAPGIPSLAGFIHVFGLWFLFVPVAWCLLSIWRGQEFQGIGSITGGQLILGFILTSVLVTLFFLGTLSAFMVAFRPY